MKILYARLSKGVRELLTQFSHLGEELDIKLYLVGGPVRDLLLNRKVLDLDLVVNRNLDVFLRELRKKFSFKVERTQFLTAKVYSSDFTVDIAQARKESYPRPGALPEVSPGTVKDDAFRRDFTINALYLRLIPEGFGELIDYVGGIEDLNNKVIRVVKKNSFEEDPTRIIRAIRYEQRFSFRMEEGTLSFLKKAISRDIFSTITPQRLGAEFLRTLREDNFLNPLLRMNELCGFSFLNSKIKLDRDNILWLKRWQSSPYRKKIVNPEIITLMILTPALTLSEVEQIAHILELKRRERKLFSRYVKLDRRRILSSLSEELSISKIYDKLKNFEIEIVVCLYLCAQGKARRNLHSYLKRILELELKIKGEDIKKLGIAEGPRMGYLLEKLKKAKLEGKVKTKKEEIQYLRRILQCG